LISKPDFVCILQTGKARKKISAMPLRRRDRQTPDLPEDREMSRERGRQVPNPAMERDIHDLCTRVVDMEIKQSHTAGVGDVSESESEDEDGHEREEVIVEDVANEFLIKAVARMGAREKMDIPVYEGNLDDEEILD
jgi:hypothetical protein